MHDLSVFWIPLVAILVWAVLAAVRIWSRTRIRELQIRERIAMIEKGLVPPPEVDPVGFDRAMARYDRSGRRGGRVSGRHRRAGITLMGVGFGLMLMISLVGDNSRQGIGVGGFLVIFGLAFLINGLFEAREDTGAAMPPRPTAPPPAHTPPQE